MRLTKITCQYLDNSSFITFRQTWVLGAVCVCEREREREGDRHTHRGNEKLLSSRQRIYGEICEVRLASTLNVTRSGVDVI